MRKINQLIAYDFKAVRNKLTIAKVKTWYKGGLIDKVQFANIQNARQSNLFSPTIFIRILLFVATFFGLTTVLGPIFLLVGDSGETSVRLTLIVFGAAILFLIEKIIIRDKNHFKSGVTEAGYYTGLAFIYFGILGIDETPLLAMWITGLLFHVFCSIRYLDLLSVIGGIICILAILFIAFDDMLSLLPFLIIITFLILYLVSQSIQKSADELIWEDHFIIFDTLALLLVYLGGNYFVVRELSVEMMRLNLAEGQDIPFAWLFYSLTFLIPVGYLAWGILKKSILFIRVGLLVLALSVITIKYYYSLGQPEVTVTVVGGLTILIALALIKYLKKSRNGFIRDQIVKSKWDNTDLAAFIASQTLGGHQVNEPDELFKGQGGEYGGGGASGEY